MSDNPILPVHGSLTLGDAIRQTADAFDEHELGFAHGTDNAIDEASWLLLDTLGFSPLLEPDYTRQLQGEERERCNKVISRRIQERVPTAYITGTAWFAGHEFVCDQRALVPRSPLAEWINADFFGLLPATHTSAVPLRILDLCTGSGSIAIAIAHALPNALIDASDLSADALQLALENVQLHNLQDRVTLHQGSLFEPVPGSYDLIVSNPPYVDAADLRAMSAEFHHEPAMGLASGEDGLDFVRQLLAEAAMHLSDNGVLVVEVGNSAEALSDAYPQLPFLWLEFQYGGSGVFVLTGNDLDAFSQAEV